MKESPQEKIARVSVSINISSQMHNIPTILQEISSQIQRRGYCWEKSNSSDGSCWDFECKARKF